jgi:hypothetical protein
VNSYIFGKPFSENWTSRLSVFAEVLPNYLWSYESDDRTIILNCREDIDHLKSHSRYFPNTFSTNLRTVELLENHDAFRTWSQINGLDHLLPSKPTAFPYFFKANRSSGGTGVILLHNESDLQREAQTHSDYGWSTQEPIPGNVEYVTHALVKDGQCVNLVTFGCILPKLLFVKCGPMSGVRCECPDAHGLAQVFSALNYTGFACTNYKMRDGKMKLFEINTRMGASLVFNPAALKEMMDAFSNL